jgi:predicted lipoprotein with Yx(FWY)xxD motif
MRRTLAAGALILGLILTGCSSGGSTTPASDGAGDSYGAPSSEPSQPAASDSGLKVADTSLGSVVVDGNGMTAYMFDKDTQGATESACTGACLQNWPPITVSSDKPVGAGITGELGTIKTADGKMQVTLDGWPLYLFAGDQKAGDVTGQGVQDVWWVVDAAGKKIGG